MPVYYVAYLYTVQSFIGFNKDRYFPDYCCVYLHKLGENDCYCFFMIFFVFL